LLAAALPSSAHTYRLLIIKEPVPPAPHLIFGASLSNRFVRQQQRDEIMQPFLDIVNNLARKIYTAFCFISPSP
jgi:hypothetical protein